MEGTADAVNTPLLLFAYVFPYFEEDTEHTF